MNEDSFLNMLSTYHKRMEQAKHQETKDSILCQLVLSLFQFVPSQEVRDKIKEILQTYNSEDRIPEAQRISARYCIRAGENLCFAFKTYVKKMYEEMQEKHPKSKVEICHMQEEGALELVEISDEEYTELGIERQ